MFGPRIIPSFLLTLIVMLTLALAPSRSFASVSQEKQFVSQSGCNSGNNDFKNTVLFEMNKGEYNNYRIPSLIVTKKGTVLAFCEGRADRDTGDVDLLVRRSKDCGKSWSEKQVVWSDGRNTCGNPCPVVDQDTGRIWLMMTWNFGGDHGDDIVRWESKDVRKPYVCYSDDDGKTWSTPVDISETARKDDWRWYATGPGNGIQIQKGKYKGRLVFPANHSYTETRGDVFRMADKYGYGSHVIYSDNHGKSWKISESITPGCNESTVAELSDSRLMMNMRSYNGKKYRALSFSSDGGVTWSPVEHDQTLIERVTQASLISYHQDDKHLLIFSNPANQNESFNLTIRVSRDDGRTWPIARQVHATTAGYSSIAVLPNGNIGCFHEAGLNNIGGDSGEIMYFKVISMDSLINDDPQKTLSITWKSDLEYPSLIKGPAAGVIDGRLMVSGGMSFPWREVEYGYWLATEDTAEEVSSPVIPGGRIKPQAGHWYPLPPLPIGPGWTSGTAVAGGLAVVGGRRQAVGTRATADVWFLDIHAAFEVGGPQWERLPDRPSPAMVATTFAEGDYLYTVFGTDWDPHEHSIKDTNVYRMNVRKRSGWETVTRFPGKPRWFAPTTICNGKLYVIGGRDKPVGGVTEFSPYNAYGGKGGLFVPSREPNGKAIFEYFSEMWEYEFATDKWRQLPRPPRAFASEAFTVADRWVVVPGGRNFIVDSQGVAVAIKQRVWEFNFLADSYEVWAYDTLTGDWSILESLPYGICSHRVAKWKDRVYIVGHETSDPARENTFNTVFEGRIRIIDKE